MLSISFELRVLLAREPSALSAFGRIFVQEIFRWQRGKAMLWGHARNGQQVRGAAVNYPQRFGGSLNLNVHFHVVVPDAFFYRDENGGVARALLQKPSAVELSEITHNVAVRCLRWLRRHGFLQSEAEDVEYFDVPSVMDACLEGSVGLGELIELRPSGKGRKSEEGKAGVGTKRVKAGEFNIHAGVTAQTKEERERLIRGRTHRLLYPLQQRGLSPEPYTPRQRRQLSDREVYAAAPQQDWDQSPQDTSQQGDRESPQTESEQIESDDSIDWDQSEQGSEASDWDQSEQSSGGETSLREGKAQVRPDDW